MSTDIKILCASVIAILLMPVTMIVIMLWPRTDDFSYTDVPEVRTELIAGIESCQPVDSIVDYFKKEGYSGEVSSSIFTPGQSWAPTFRHDDIEIQSFEHLGFKGKLALKFFNNRLWITKFETDDMDAYITALEEKLGVDLRGDSSYKINSSVRTRVYAINYEGELLPVTWVDTLIGSEWSRHIGLYSEGEFEELPTRKF